jgi:hypothetical protein
MVFRFRLKCVATISKPPLCNLNRGRSYSTENQFKESKPLRILFCGSDEFSSASLRAIHAEQQQQPGFIRSIDVLCRPGKPFGRSLKAIREGTQRCFNLAVPELTVISANQSRCTGIGTKCPRERHLYRMGGEFYSGCHDLVLNIC